MVAISPLVDTFTPDPAWTCARATPITKNSRMLKTLCVIQWWGVAAFIQFRRLPFNSFATTSRALSTLVMARDNPKDPGDFTRIFVYGSHFYAAGGIENLPLLVAATASAFLGAFIGNRLMKKVTMRTIQLIVSVMLSGIALALGSGLI
jgi:hypothetical protein